MKKMRPVFLLVLFAVLASGLIFSLYVREKIASIKTLRASVEEPGKGGMVIAENDGVQAQNLRKLFPENADVAGFIEEIYRTAGRRAIQNLSFEQRNREFIEIGSGRILKGLPLSGQKPAIIYSYPVKINFNSGYRSTAEFIREIQNQGRLVTIENLKIKRGKELLEAEMVITIYSTGEK